MLNSSEDEETSSNYETSNNTSDRRRRKQFSVQEKKKILDEIDKGIKKCIIAQKYHISSSTLSTFIKYREKIEKSVYSPFVDPYRKRVHASQLSNIEKSSKNTGEESNASLHNFKDCLTGLQISHDLQQDNDSPITLLRQNNSPEDRKTFESNDSSKLEKSKGKRKRKQFSLQEKKIILEALDRGVDPKQVAREFGIHGSTIFTFIRCKKQIEENITKMEKRLKAKRLRPSPFEAIDKAVYEWILQSKCESLPVNSKLRKLALSFADSLGITNFKGSIGWLYRFKDHYGIGNNFKMKNTKDDNTKTDMVLRSRERKSKKSTSINSHNMPKAAVNRIKCPCDHESKKDNSKMHIKQKKDKHKRVKKSRQVTKLSTSDKDIHTISSAQNPGSSECSVLSVNKETLEKNSTEFDKNTVGQRYEVMELNNSCIHNNQLHSETIVINAKSSELLRSIPENTEPNEIGKKSGSDFLKNTKDDSSISYIISASDAVSMASKLRQFIMAHKDIPNYVQDSCDIICDYTERCVQQEKTKKLSMCNKR